MKAGVDERLKDGYALDSGMVRPVLGRRCLIGDKKMKDGIHPDYKAITIECACGAVANTRSTMDSFKVDICSECHPFYTGKQKFVDSAGRVERFNKKYGLKTTNPS